MEHDFEVILQSQSNLKLQVSDMTVTEKPSILHTENFEFVGEKNIEHPIHFREPSIYGGISHRNQETPCRLLETKTLHVVAAPLRAPSSCLSLVLASSTTVFRNCELAVLLLMAEILHHLGCIKPCK